MNIIEDLNGDIDWSEFHVVGTCQDIEKPYLRLTSVSHCLLFVCMFSPQNYLVDFN
jgi:hypothetical protein